MRAIVKLEEILEEIEMQIMERSAFVNVKTGKIVSVSDDYLRDAEDGEPYDHLKGWEQDEMKIAYYVIGNFENYQELPSEFDMNEYSMIEDFCFSVKNKKEQDALLRAIRGKGAFRRFKDMIIDFDLEQDWFDYRDSCYKQIAIDFCEMHNLEYIE